MTPCLAAAFSLVFGPAFFWAAQMGAADLLSAACGFTLARVIAVPREGGGDV